MMQSLRCNFVLARAARRGFTMVEVLFATMILGIGLIMVAGIFPVAADWTRGTTEESVAPFIAQNAVNIIQTKYSAGDLSTVTTTTYQQLPSFATKLPLLERAYALGQSPPYPLATQWASGATYSVGQHAYQTGSAWVSGKSYAVDDVVSYNSGAYRCVAAHTSNSSNQPPNASFWTDSCTYVCLANHTASSSIQITNTAYWLKEDTVSPASKATYYWTALIRATPGRPTGSQQFDLTILVFRPGSIDQVWNTSGYTLPTAYAGGLTVVDHPVWTSSTAYSAGAVVTYGLNVYRCTTAHTASVTNSPASATPPWALMSTEAHSNVPFVCSLPAASEAISTLSTSQAKPSQYVLKLTGPTKADWNVSGSDFINSLGGSQIMDPVTGTVWRVVSVDIDTANTSPSEAVLFVNAPVPSLTSIYVVPGAIGTTATPLVHVYQTTVNF